MTDMPTLIELLSIALWIAGAGFAVALGIMLLLLGIIAAALVTAAFKAAVDWMTGGRFSRFLRDSGLVEVKVST